MATTWYFSNDELIRGLNTEEQKIESSQRRQTCAFLQDAGMKLRLPQLTIATAVIFFHRFYARYRFKDYDRYIIGTTCLFLAGKVEETPKKLKDVIEVTYNIRHKSREPPKVDSPEFNQIKDQILTHELIVLQTIAFDLTVEHPYKYLLSYVKGIQGNRNLAQVAWNFVNDSLRTTLCLQHRPQLIASAAIYLASKFLKYQLPEGKRPWWEVFDARIDDLELISTQILDLYDSSSTQSMPVKPPTSFNNDAEIIKSTTPASTILPSIQETSTSTNLTSSSNSNTQEKDKSSSSTQQPQSTSSSRSSSTTLSSNRRSRSRSPDRKDRSSERDRSDRDKERSSDRDRDRGTKRRSRSPRSPSRSPRSRSRSRSRSPSRRRSGPVRHTDSRDSRDSRDRSYRSSSSGSGSNSLSRSSSSAQSGSASRSRDSRDRREDDRGGRYHPYDK